MNAYGEIQGVNLWDSKVYKWNDYIERSARLYNSTIHTDNDNAKKIGDLSKLVKDKDTYIYYVITPEMTYVGDAKTTKRYDSVVRDQIAILRKHGGDRLKIILGYFLRSLHAFRKFIAEHPEQMAAVDYLGPTFHQLNELDVCVATRIFNFFVELRKVTTIPFLFLSIINSGLWCQTYRQVSFGSGLLIIDSVCSTLDFIDGVYQHHLIKLT